MNCSNCGTEINPNERFCRNCGHEAVPLTEVAHSLEPTLYLPQAEVTGSHKAGTAQVWPPQPTAPYAAPPETATRRGRSPLLIFMLVALGVLFIGGIGTLAYFLLRPGNDVKKTDVAGALPDHFGVFIRDGDSLDELRRRDFSDALQGRDAMMGETSLPEAEAKPTFIIYAEPQDIPISDLKLVQLDKIDSSGSVHHWSYQVAPVEGRSGMKQIKVARGLASGKYAFALINGSLNEGNHKFWPFQVEDGAPTPSESPLVAMIPVKQKSSPTPTPTVEAPPQSTPTPVIKEPTGPPVGATLAYCNDDNVVLRGSPNLNGRKVNRLNRGQKLWVIGVSANYSTWNGVTANWTHVQLYNRAERGWVFSPFISYQ